VIEQPPAPNGHGNRVARNISGKVSANTFADEGQGVGFYRRWVRSHLAEILCSIGAMTPGVTETSPI
jgi:hypothetical protein